MYTQTYASAAVCLDVRKGVRQSYCSLCADTWRVESWIKADTLDILLSPETEQTGAGGEGASSGGGGGGTGTVGAGAAIGIPSIRPRNGTRRMTDILNSTGNHS